MHLVRENKKYIPLFVVGIIASFIITTCDSVNAEGELIVNDSTIAKGIILSILLGVLYWKIGTLCECIKERDNKHDKMGKKKVFFLSCVMFVCWMPYLLALYPANFLGDTMISIGWFVNTLEGATGLLSDHNPILTVLLYGGFVWIGQHLLHNVSLALFIFVLIQSACCCLVFSISCEYMLRKLKLPPVFSTFCFLFYCFCPLFPVWNNFIAKDSSFSWVYVLYLMYYIEIVRTEGEVLATSKKHTVLFCIVCLLACLLKKLGFYIILVSGIIVFFWFCWKKKKKECIRFGYSLVLIVTVMQILLPKIIFPMFGIQKGETYEILSVPLQQTARYVVDYPDEVTSSEREVIDRLLGYDDLAERYEYWIVDPVKYEAKESKQAYKDWIKVYIQQGLKHPFSYVESFFALEKGFGQSDLNFTLQFNSEYMKDYDSTGISETYIREGMSKRIAEFVEKIYVWFSNLPGLDIFFRCCTYTVIIPCFFFGITLMVKKRMLLMMFPTLFTLGGIWLSPVSTIIHGSRYILPLLYTAPLISALCIWGVMKWKEEAYKC